MKQKNTKTYCDTRLEELGITAENNKFTIINEGGKFQDVYFFTPDSEDNITINYLSLDKSLQTYLKNGKGISFARTRVNPSNVNNAKYLSPAKSGNFFFYPPQIIEAFIKKKKIETLIVTEGEFKAFKACLHGITCVGIAGIHNYKDKSIDDLPDDFKRLVITCNVKNIIFLLDADCISENYIKQALIEEKDLGKRLNSFYHAVRSFRELCKEFNTDIYFSHIKPEFESTAKGLDDLLVFLKGKEEQIKNDLLKLSKSTKFFETENITDNSLSKVYEKFLQKADNKRLPTQFYEKFQAIIGDSEFIFNKIKYKHGDDGLKIIYHPEAANYIRVGTAHYRKGHTVSSKGENIPELLLWKFGTIKQDFGHIPRFIDMVPKYINFVNVPDNTHDYIREIQGCYNLYEPIKCIPIKGSYQKTLEFLNHIFGNKIDVGLDYLSLVYTNPNQNLPVLCLVSKKQKTGKSTFLKWLCDIYGANAIILGNEDFQGKFNSHYASKLIIGIDEGFIDKKLIKEKIKRLATDNRINLEAKGRDIIRMSFFGKFILCSNNEDNFIQMEEEDNRFFVLKINVIHEENPFLLDALKLEIPAFLHFISTRKIINPNKSRLWFSPEIYETDALMKVIKNSRHWTEKAMLNWFNDMFENEEVGDIITITPKILASELKHELKNINNLRDEIEKILKEKWGFNHQGTNKRFRYPRIGEQYNDSEQCTEQTLRWNNANGKCYEISKDFIENISK